MTPPNSLAARPASTDHGGRKRVLFVIPDLTPGGAQRLVLDLIQGEEALRNGEQEQAHERLIHAQEIILELRTSLDVDAWSGGPGLASMYGYLLTELIGANIARDADRVQTCRTLVEPLRDAWREAAAAAAAS